MQKDIPPKKVFGNSEFCSSRQNHSRPNSLENCGFGGKNKTQSFQKLSGDIFFEFVEYFCNRSLKIKGGESSSQFRWFTIAKIEQ